MIRMHGFLSALKDHSSRNTWEFVEAFLPSLLSFRAGQQLTESISGEITKLCNSSPQILLKTQTDPHRISSSVKEGALRCICGKHLCLSVCTAYIACTQLWGEWDELERLLAVFPSSGQNTACSPLVRLSQASTR